MRRGKKVDGAGTDKESLSVGSWRLSGVEV